MKALKADELLTVWEQGLNQPLLRRALILLAAAFPEIPADRLAQLSIGQRDGLLMQIRECLFGQTLLNTAVCPECNERIEWQNTISDFLLIGEEVKKPEDKFDLNTNGYQLLFRLPNSLDMTAVVNSTPVEQQQHKLLSRCVLNIEQEGMGMNLDQLPDSAIQALIARMEELDPQADIRLNLTCPECSHAWTVLFDIASFLWIEVNDWAERMLRTVYQLAAGYGWSERDILNLSPVRRQLYLGLMGG
jgi:hypothetical protein